MNRIRVARAAILLPCTVILAACPLDGRPRRSNCAIAYSGVEGAAWVGSQIDYYLTDPANCPLELPATMTWVSLYASITAPAGNIRGDYFESTAWNARNDLLHYQIDPWYWATYTSLEADVSFYYQAGTGTPVAGYFSDRAEGRTGTSYGVDGVASALLTYRKGLLTS